MRHLARFRIIVSRMAPSNDREVYVTVDVNVFHADPQARWISADITSGKLKIVHHRISSLSRMQRAKPLTTDDRPLRAA
jgi:hypothetical protein